MTDLFDTYRSQLDAIKGVMPDTDSVRDTAFALASKAGMPTRRHEDWRYSNLGDITKVAYSAAKIPANIHNGNADSGDDIDIDFLCETTSARMVFINGKFDEELSDLSELLQVARVKHISNHFNPEMDRSQEIAIGTDTLEQLNTALMRDGMVLAIPSGIEIDDPVEIIHLVLDSDQAAAHNRNIIELGEGASLTIVERHLGDTSHYWTNFVSQIRISEGAELHHILLQEEGENARLTRKNMIDVDAEGRYNACVLQLGSKASRIHSHMRVLGGGAHGNLDGAVLASTDSALETINTVKHLVPGATSDQTFRAVIDAKGISSFQGKIVVAEGAQQTEADQSCRSLLLDRSGEANAKPELEIFADDVKCSHGATVGELDNKALFYLLSRGIDPNTARQMLIEAFAADALVNVHDDDLREILNDRILNWMQQHMSGKGSD